MYPQVVGKNKMIEAYFKEGRACCMCVRFAIAIPDHNSFCFLDTRLEVANQLAPKPAKRFVLQSNRHHHQTKWSYWKGKQLQNPSAWKRVHLVPGRCQAYVYLTHRFTVPPLLVTSALARTSLETGLGLRFGIPDLSSCITGGSFFCHSLLSFYRHVSLARITSSLKDPARPAIQRRV